MGKKSLLYIFLLTIFFSIIIFFIKNYFFIDENKKAEENYIEYSLLEEKNNDITKVDTSIYDVSKDYASEEEEKIKKDELIQPQVDIKEKYIEKVINFIYNPENYINETKYSSDLISQAIKPQIFNKKIQNNVKIELNKEIIDGRGQMKNKTVKLFGIKEMDDSELISVFVHEFSHYIDIYSLDKTVFQDVSDYFYDISWVDTKILKSGQKQEDFVSGYAMTNKYEDFAETMTYYILHNFSFGKKSEKSPYLREKYEFISKYVFRKNEFKNMDFGKSIEIGNYYRDITKMKINTTIFLQYLLNNI